MAKRLVAARDASAGPRPGEDLAEWLREAYARLLLRFPTAAEAESALATLRKEGEASWQALLVLLAASSDYATY